MCHSGFQMQEQIFREKEVQTALCGNTNDLITHQIATWRYVHAPASHKLKKALWTIYCCSKMSFTRAYVHKPHTEKKEKSDILITFVTHQLNYLHILQSGKLGKLSQWWGNAAIKGINWTHTDFVTHISHLRLLALVITKNKQAKKGRQDSVSQICSLFRYPVNGSLSCSITTVELEQRWGKGARGYAENAWVGTLFKTPGKIYRADKISL